MTNAPEYSNHQIRAAVVLHIADLEDEKPEDGSFAAYELPDIISAWRDTLHIMSSDKPERAYKTFREELAQAERKGWPRNGAQAHLQKLLL